MPVRLGRGAVAVAAGFLVLTACDPGLPKDDGNLLAEPTTTSHSSTQDLANAASSADSLVRAPSTTAAVAPPQSPESGTRVESGAPPATPPEAYEENGEEQVVVVPEPPDPEDAVGRAIADLAKRLGVDESAISVVSVDQVIWRDASLGCPEPGQAYAQILTPGSRIVLSASGATYEYHSGLAGDPFYCADPEPPAATT